MFLSAIVSSHLRGEDNGRSHHTKRSKKWRKSNTRTRRRTAIKDVERNQANGYSIENCRTPTRLREAHTIRYPSIRYRTVNSYLCLILPSACNRHQTNGRLLHDTDKPPPTYQMQNPNVQVGASFVNRSVRQELHTVASTHQSRAILLKIHTSK